jgi:hypothetical protein
MPKTRMGYERIKRMHEAGDHSRCKFGCSPDNLAPPQEREFAEGYSVSSRELAERLGRSDPRVSVALDIQEYLDTKPDLPPLILAELGTDALMIEDLSGEEPDALDTIKVRGARRLLESCLNGVYDSRAGAGSPASSPTR